MSGFDKFATFVVVGTAFLFVAPLIGVTVGAFSGWIVGMFFSDAIRLVLRHAGIDTAGVEVWQLGATLGFVGGFFRSTTTNKSS